MRSTTSVLSNFRLADARWAIRFVRNMLSGYQILKDSTIVYQSPNVGKISRVKVICFHIKLLHKFIRSTYDSFVIQ